MNLEPEGAAARCRPAIARLDADRAVERMWSGDGTFWKIEAVARKRIEGALGWLALPETARASLPELERFAASWKGRADRVLLLAVGGAALSPAVFATLPRAAGFPSLEILDSIEPAAVSGAAARVDPSRTLFVVSARSGSTFETNLLFDTFFENARQDLGDRTAERFVVIADADSSLDRAAVKRGISAIFRPEASVGGAFAALSLFGLVPAALCGVDVSGLLARARRMAEACRIPAALNPGILLGAALATEAAEGRDKLTLSIDPPLEPFGRWLEQLVAGATGKDGRGIVPIDGESLGPPGFYGSDRFFVRYETAGRPDPSASARACALVAHGQTVATFRIVEPLDIGAEMFRWQFAAAVAAHRLGVHPFDEPETENVRRHAAALLSGSARSGPAAPEPAGARDALNALAGSIRDNDYFAVSAYLRETPETDAALQRIAMKVRRARRVATSVHFAPRLLHTAGQVQKGGPNSGTFLQVETGAPSPMPAAGRAWGFADILGAQAEADAESLLARGRRVVRVRLGADEGRGLEDLTAAVDAALAASASPGRPPA